MLAGSIALSVLYVAWSWHARSIVLDQVEDALDAAGLDGAPVFLTPTPFNTLLWRIVVLTDDGFLEGFDSLVIDEEELRFEAYSSDMVALDNASNVWAVGRLRWFAQDFVKAEVHGDRLLISDLRMGTEPAYVFTHAVAVRGNPHWLEIPTELIPVSFGDRALAQVWRRIWSE